MAGTNTLSAPSGTVVREHPDGSVTLRSAQSLGDCPDTVIHSLRIWALKQPYYPLAAERDLAGDWHMCSYAEAAAAADAIGEALLQMGLGPGKPLLILSRNSLSHLLMMLGAMTAGIPVAPVGVDHSLRSRGYAQLRSIAALLSPGAVFAEDAGCFSAALDALCGLPAIIATGRRAGAIRLRSLLATHPGAAIARAFALLEPGSLAKILFRSGPDGELTGVLNTHRMLSASQQMMRQAVSYLREERPLVVDWQPWNHAFGGNHNLNMVLTNGGTMYIDAGRPAPGRFEQTIANLAEIPPTIYFNVPAGYAWLVPALESDAEFARRFFSRLRLALNGTAAPPAELQDRFRAVARRTTGREMPVTASWGASETGPTVTTGELDYHDTRCIGFPLPGAEVKLVPVNGAYEIRVRGPMVTPGYLGRPDLTAAAFDEGGFYRSGGAATLANFRDPGTGLLFYGRIAAAAGTSRQSGVPVAAPAR